MARGPAEIQIEGMKEVRKSLRTMSSDNGWRAPLRDSYRKAAALGQDEAQSLARAGGTTLAGTSASMGSRAVASIRGKGTTTGASLEAFKGIPWGSGWNFGASRRRQFPARTKPDYALYKAVENKREEIVETFANEVDSALNKEF